MCFPPCRRPKFIPLTKRMFSFAIFCTEKKTYSVWVRKSASLLKVLCLEWKKRLSDSLSHRSIYSEILPVFSLWCHFQELCPTSRNIILLMQKADIHRYSQKTALLSYILQNCDKIMKGNFLITSHTLIF